MSPRAWAQAPWVWVLVPLVHRLLYAGLEGTLLCLPLSAILEAVAKECDLGLKLERKW